MDLEIFLVSEVRQKWKDKYDTGITYMCDLKNNANLSTNQSHKQRKQHMVTKGGKGGRDKFRNLGLADTHHCM